MVIPHFIIFSYRNSCLTKFCHNLLDIFQNLINCRILAFMYSIFHNVFFAIKSTVFLKMSNFNAYSKSILILGALKYFPSEYNKTSGKTCKTLGLFDLKAFVSFFSHLEIMPTEFSGSD